MRPTTIELNGRTFADSKENAIADSASGFYRRTRSEGITIFTLDGERVGGINRHGVLHSSRGTPDGWWHTYATPAIVGEYESLRQERHECHAALLIAQRAAATTEA